MLALCINCGAAKSHPWEKCPDCGYIPVGEDLVKSVYCSTGRFANDPDRIDEYENQLNKMSSDIRSGIGISYDQEDLARLRSERNAVNQYSPSVGRILLRIAWPAIVVLFIFLTLVVLRYFIF